MKIEQTNIVALSQASFSQDSPAFQDGYQDGLSDAKHNNVNLRFSAYSIDAYMLSYSVGYAFGVRQACDDMRVLADSSLQA